MRLFPLFFLFVSYVVAAPLDVEVTSKQAILMNMETGAILYEKRAHEKAFPASTTKIATVGLALQHLEGHLDDEVVAEQDDIGSVSSEAKKRANYSLPSHWLEKDATHMGIKKGEILPVRALIYGNMLTSADDASNMIARYVGGTIPKFMDLLNDYVQSLGCHHTHFTNPHGLHHPDHYTTPYDMALITADALQNPTFREVIQTTRYQRPKTNMQDPSPLVNFNKLLRPGKLYYDKAIGVKTGYIAAAQNTFVGAAYDPKSDRTLIAVLMGCKERSEIFADTVRLFEAAFQQPKLRRILLQAGEQKWVVPAENSTRAIPTSLAHDVLLDYYPAEEPKVRCFLHPKHVTLPVAQGDEVATLEIITNEGVTLDTVPLYASHDVKKGFFERIFG